MFCSDIASRPSLWSIRHLVYKVKGVLSPGEKPSWRLADHAIASS
jgi:hypothetical protein